MFGHVNGVGTLVIRPETTQFTLVRNHGVFVFHMMLQFTAMIVAALALLAKVSLLILMDDTEMRIEVTAILQYLAAYFTLDRNVHKIYMLLQQSVSLVRAPAIGTLHIL